MSRVSRAFRLIGLLAAATTAAAAGCTHLQLHRSAVRQARSITDLQYQQVLDNLAQFHCNPETLPHFSVVGTGGTSVNDQGTASTELEWSPYAIVREQLGLEVTREIEEQWTLAPVVNPDKLRAIRCLFQLVAAGETSDREADSLLRSFLGDDYSEWIRRGWYGVGGRRDVPKEACYVGQCGACRVWVTPDQLDALTRLTIVVLNIATLDPAPPPAQPTKTVYRYAYTPEGQLESMEVLTRPDPDAPKATPSQVRKDFYNPLQSQLQLRSRD